jgi:hypothetical protein
MTDNSLLTVAIGMTSLWLAGLGFGLYWLIF